ncbi:MAG: bacillithiol biosynthesis deacetylase BshB1 [Saprospiraceae bacterium]|nr:bacillithiol biosynthesis deacetylase BshB1 [Saprospiraceae bacterium]
MKVDILAIGVHPDDIELGCGGTLLKHIALGKKIGLVDLTQGELGTRGTAETRKEEAEDSKNIMGALVRENLKMADGFFQHTEENILKICRVVRKYKPEIVLANAISDRHPDHGRASKLTSDACFYSGLAKIEITDEDGSILEPWRPKAVYHYIQDRNLKADFTIDISNYMEKKMKCILAYKTQFNLTDYEGPKTPISGKSFMDFVRSKHQTYGRDINASYAEGFTVERTIGVRNLFDLM